MRQCCIHFSNAFEFDESYTMPILFSIFCIIIFISCITHKKLKTILMYYKKLKKEKGKEIKFDFFFFGSFSFGF